MSFLPSLFLLPWFPACWASCHFPCTGVPSVQLPPHELSPSGASAVLSLRLAGAKLRLFQPGHIRVTAPYICWGSIISSVLSCRSKDLKWWASVTVQSFIRQVKESTPSGCEGRPSPNERPQSSWHPPFIHFSPPRRACPRQIGLAKKGACLFPLKFSLQVASFLLFYFHGLFPFFVFKPSPFWTPSSYSNYLTSTTDTGSKILTHRMKGVHGRLWGAVGFSSWSVATLLCQASKTWYYFSRFVPQDFIHTPQASGHWLVLTT